MTRWTRANNAHRKRPSEPTSWQQLKQQRTDSSPLPKQVDENKKGKDDSSLIESESRLHLVLKPKTKRQRQRGEKDTTAPPSIKREQTTSPEFSAEVQTNLVLIKKRLKGTAEKGSSTPSLSGKKQKISPQSSSSKAEPNLVLKRKKKRSKRKVEKGSNTPSHSNEKQNNTPELSSEANVGDMQSKSRNRQAKLHSNKKDDSVAIGLPASEKKRLKNLEMQLSEKGLSRPEVWKVMRKEKSKVMRLEKRRKISKTCFKCRKFGHVIADCPNAEASMGAVICFRCGSTEHTSKGCKNQTRTGKDAFPYATCFVCGEQGHLSSLCPDNPDGIYPHGGCCNECGSVRHLRKDCPDLQKTREDSSEVVVHLLDQRGSADAEVTEVVPKNKWKKGPKIIAFK